MLVEQSRKRSAPTMLVQAPSTFKKQRSFLQQPAQYQRPRFQRQNAVMIKKAEANHVDIARATYNANSTGVITLLNTISQGPSQNERIGKRCYLKNIGWKGRVRANATATQQEITMMIIYDRRPTGALPGILDILEEATPTSFLNDDNTSRFEVLKREYWTLNGNTSTTTSSTMQYPFDIFVPLKKRPVVFNSVGTGTISDIEEGALYHLIIGSEVAGTTAGNITGNVRVRFTEY